MFEALWMDVRLALRTFRKNAVFSIAAIAILALGIGANTAIFSLVDHVILRPLAYRDSARLYAIHEHIGGIAAKVPPLLPVNAMHFIEWQKNLRSFDELALISGFSLNLTGSGAAERLYGARVSWNLFHMLGATPLIGRTFAREEDAPGREHEVILNYGLWKSHFGGDPNIIGRKILLDGEPYQVIGVWPPSFEFPKIGQLYAMDLPEQQPQFWKPFALRKDELSELGDFDFACIAHLKPTVTPAQAQHELNGLQAQLAKRAPIPLTLSAVMIALGRQITGRVRTGLELVFGAVTLLLLIACVNLASLLLARGAARKTEMAIRSAIGASGTRLLRQLLAESLTLALAGGALGIAVAYGAERVIVSVAPIDVPRIDEVRIDSYVLLFALAISIAAGVLFGILPAWSAAREDAQQALKASGRGTTEAGTARRSRSFLVGVEVCLCAICLAGAGLLLHSFVKLVSIDKGFQISRLVTAEIEFPQKAYPDVSKRANALKAILERMHSLPDAEDVGVTNRIPLSGEGENNLFTAADQLVPLGQRPFGNVRVVSPDYFRTIGIPLQAGHGFADLDRSHPVTVISAMTAAKLWPGKDPIGRAMVLGDEDKKPLQVIGVVQDIRGESLDKAPVMTLYVPYWQRSSFGMTVVMKTTVTESTAARAIRAVIRQVDAQIPVEHFQTMAELLNASVAQRRFQMELVILFAICALLLASLGIYGVVAYSVAQRTNEIGIRMSLGAEKTSIGQMVLAQGLRPVLIGLAAGIVGSIGLSRAISGLLFGVQPADPLTLGGVAAVLLAVAAAAILIPALRAARVNPLEALRYH